MELLDWIKTNFVKNGKSSSEKISVQDELQRPKFKIVVIEFSDNVESSSGETVARMLSKKNGLAVSYFDEPFSKTFLNLESRTLFDLIDKGQDLLDKSGADVLIWGYRDGNKIRLNFQTAKQYENEDAAFVSLMDSLYIPAHMTQDQGNFPDAVSELIYGAVISAINTDSKETKIYKKYLLKKIIDKLSKDNSAKNLSIEYMPYVMNFLGIIYLSYAYENSDNKDFKIVKNLFDTAIKHQDLITSQIHLGCIYNHLGQLYDSAAEHMEKKPANYFRGAIEYYRYAQKYLSKYNYPYDYGQISYKLARLYFNYWRQKEDIQALRDAVFQLREAEKIYTYALFPEFWASIQGDLGHLLSLLGNFSKSEDISELAVTCYKNQQKIITERRDPLAWAKIQSHIGEIYYRLGKGNYNKALLEESLEYFHDALYIFENVGMNDEVKQLTVNIARASQTLNMA